ncbi:hypothetical protein MGI18_13835 [Bacillus sp. OVS6]|nr:hypothetical protein MGI18_13835 [Bacillus sp. OVS6]
MAIRCDNKELPITIAFNHGDYSEDKVFNSIYPLNQYVRQASVMEIYENLKTGLKFYADNEDSFDEHASIEIQTSLYDTKDVQESKIVPLTKEPIIHWLYKRKDQEVFPWRMGTYLMKIHYKGNLTPWVFCKTIIFIS